MLEGTESLSKKLLLRPDVQLVYRNLTTTSHPKPTLVFIHGWAGSANDWRLLVDQFVARGEAVLVYDAAGFGESQFTDKKTAQRANYSLERYVEDLKLLLEAEGISKVRLVGHSWGGVVAMSFAAQYPTQTENLVVLSSAYFDPSNLLHRVLKWASFLIGWFLILCKPLLRYLTWLHRLSLRPYFHRPPSATEVELLINDVLRSNNRAIIQTLMLGYTVQFKKLCPDIQCPTLYVGTGQDIIAPLTYVKAFMPLTIRSFCAILEDCGHFPMLEQPERLLLLLDSFFKAGDTVISHAKF